VSALISAAVHTLVLVALAATSIRLVSEDRSVVPLVIREPAPPPPPPGPGTAAVAPAVVAPLEAPQPVQPVRPEVPKKVERPKIAAKPRPKAKPEVARPQPTPVADVPAASAVAGPAAGGVIGGVHGGEIGGQVGGRLGGTGDRVWSAEQVAVPPRVIEAVRPSYPPIARARGQEAVVIVQAIIDRTGGVESGGLHVVESQPPFDAAALEAFRQWKFKPGRDDSGELVRVLVQQPIRFQLR
jgi:protein TonB